MCSKIIWKGHILLNLFHNSSKTIHIKRLPGYLWICLVCIHNSSLFTNWCPTCAPQWIARAAFTWREKPIVIMELNFIDISRNHFQSRFWKKNNTVFSSLLFLHSYFCICIYLQLSIYPLRCNIWNLKTKQIACTKTSTYTNIKQTPITVHPTIPKIFRNSFNILYIFNRLHRSITSFLAFDIIVLRLVMFHFGSRINLLRIKLNCVIFVLFRYCVHICVSFRFHILNNTCHRTVLLHLPFLQFQ